MSVRLLARSTTCFPITSEIPLIGRTVLHYCFVQPSHRGRGAGDLLVSWGLRKADELGIDSYVESTPMGKPLYEKHGFSVMNHFELKATPPPAEKVEEREELEKVARGLYMIYPFLWRPRYGRFEEGKTLVPWCSTDWKEARYVDSERVKSPNGLNGGAF